jgi:hypothetical protein
MSTNAERNTRLQVAIVTGASRAIARPFTWWALEDSHV